MQGKRVKKGTTGQAGLDTQTANEENLSPLGPVTILSIETILSIVTILSIHQDDQR